MWSPFQVGHILANPWVRRDNFLVGDRWKIAATYLVCEVRWNWLATIVPEADQEWGTHEAVIGPDEVAITPRSCCQRRDRYYAYGINPGQESEWGTFRNA